VGPLLHRGIRGHPMALLLQRGKSTGKIALTMI
jgi:hypothetical protein